MVLEVRRQPRAAVLPGAQQPAVVVAQLVEQERAARRPPPRGSRRGRAPRRRRRAPQTISAFHEVSRLSSSPGRTRPDRALEQPRADLLSAARARAARLEHVRAVLEVAVLGHAEVRDRGLGELGSEHLAQLVERPHVELSLDALGVGVERRAEATLGTAHLAQRPVERLAADARAATRRPRPASRAGRRGRAARCRRASSRSGGPSRSRRRRSAQSRRRPGRRCRRAPSPAASRATSRARRAPAAARSSTTAGTSARDRSRR